MLRSPGEQGHTGRLQEGLILVSSSSHEWALNTDEGKVGMEAAGPELASQLHLMLLLLGDLEGGTCVL